jgi:hypothetical protein
MFSCNCLRSYIIFFLHVFFVSLTFVHSTYCGNTTFENFFLGLFLELVLLMQDQIKHNNKEVKFHKEPFSN